MKKYTKLLLISGFGLQLLTQSVCSSASQTAFKEDKVENKAQFDAAITKQMFDAIHAADSEKLEQILLTGKADTNARTNDDSGCSALGKALFVSTNPDKRLELVTLLLNHGADQAERIIFKMGMLPLHYVIYLIEDPSHRLVNLFLSRNRQVVNRQDFSDNTPLMYAISGVPHATDEELHEAEITSVNIAFSTNIIKTLLLHGADITLANNKKQDALILASLRGNSEIIKILSEHNEKIKKEIVCQMRTTHELIYFPPGLLPLISDYVQ